MSIIIRLQRLAWSASAADVREFFRGMTIPEGGVHIVGGRDGDAFIAFASDEDARLAMRLDNKRLKEQRVRLLLSSRQEMQKVIDKARTEYAGMTGSGGGGGGGAPPLGGDLASLLDDDQNGSTNGVAAGGGAACRRTNSNKRGRGSRSRSRSGSRDRGIAGGMTLGGGAGGAIDYYNNASPHDIMMGGGQQQQQQQRYPGGGSRSPDSKRMTIGQQQQQSYGKSQGSMQSQPTTQLLNQLNSAILSSSSSSSNQMPTYGSAATNQAQHTPPHVHQQLQPPISQQSPLDPRLQSAHHQQHLAQQQQSIHQQSTAGLMNSSSLFGGIGGSQQIQQQSSNFQGPPQFQQQTPAGYPLASTTMSFSAATTDQQFNHSFSSSSAAAQYQQQTQPGHPAYQHLPSATSSQQHGPGTSPFPQPQPIPPPMNLNQSGPLLADGLPIFGDFDARSSGPFGQQPFAQKTSMYQHAPPTSSYQTAGVPPGPGGGGFDFSRQNAGPLLTNVPGLPAGVDYSGGRSRNRMTLLPEPGDPQMGLTLNHLPLPPGAMDQSKGFMDMNLDGVFPPQLDPPSSVLIGQSTMTSSTGGPPFGPPPPSFGGSAPPPQPPQPFLPAVGQKIQMHIQQLQAAQQAPPGGGGSGLPPLAPLPTNPHQLFREGVFMDTATFPIGQPMGNVFGGGPPSAMLAPPFEPNCCVCLDNVSPNLLRYGEIRMFFHPIKLEGSESIKIVSESNRVYCRFLNPIDTDQALRYDGREGIRIRPCQDFEFDSAQDSFRIPKIPNPPQSRGSYGVGGAQSGSAPYDRGSYDSPSNEWDSSDGRYFIALTNIAYRVSDNEIWDLVARLRPRSLRRRMIFKSGTLMTSDEAYVEFVNQKDAEDALQESRGRMLSGRRISAHQTTRKLVEREETRLFEPRQSPDYQNLTGSSLLDHDGRRPLAGSSVQSSSRDQYDSRDSRDSSKFGGGGRSRDYDRDIRDKGGDSSSRNRRRSRDRSRERDGGSQSAMAGGGGGGKTSSSTSRDRSRSRERYGSRSRDTPKDKEGSRGDDKQKDGKEKSKQKVDDKQKDGNDKSKQKDKDFRVAGSETTKLNSSENSSNSTTPILKRTTGGGGGSSRPPTEYGAGGSFGFDSSSFDQSASTAAARPPDPIGGQVQQSSSTNQNRPSQNQPPPPTNQNQPTPPQQQQQAPPPGGGAAGAEKYTCVFMTGLSPNTTIRDVQAFFSQQRVAHGGVKIMREPKGGAYVEFCSYRDCEAAVAQNNKEYIGVQVVNIRPCSKTEMTQAVQKQHGGGGGGVAPPPQQQHNQSGSRSTPIGPTVTPAKDQQQHQSLASVVQSLRAEPETMKENSAAGAGQGPINNNSSNAPIQTAPPPSRLPTLFDDEIRSPFVNRQPPLQQRPPPWGPRGPTGPQMNQHRPPFFVGGGPGPQPLQQQQHVAPPMMPPATRPVAAVAANVRGHMGLLGSEPGVNTAATGSPAAAGLPSGPPLNSVKQQQVNGGQQQQAQVTTGQQQQQPGGGPTNAPNVPAAANAGKLPTNQVGGPAEPSPATVQAPPTATRPSMPVIDSGVVANLGPKGSVCFLHNLPAHITLEEICSLFPTEQFIEDSVRMHYSHQTGEPTGDCLLAFATPTDAEGACQRTNGRTVEGHIVQMWVVPN